MNEGLAMLDRDDDHDVFNESVMSDKVPRRTPAPAFVLIRRRVLGCLYWLVAASMASQRPRHRARARC